MEGSFLDRERAILGEDAEQFGAIQDHTNNAATVEDDDGDLLGGDYTGESNKATMAGGDMDDFESSFPAIDTQNEVSKALLRDADRKGEPGALGNMDSVKLAAAFSLSLSIDLVR
jgi:hypothetical protein